MDNHQIDANSASAFINELTPITSITVTTDGSCSGNPGHWGWAAIIHYLSGSEIVRETEISGGGAFGTNNLAELTAAREAIAAIREANLAPPETPVTLRSDSQQVIKGMTEWLPNWKRNNWRASGGKKEVANKALYMALDFLTLDLNVTYEWVKGHGNDALNIRADKLAVAARDAHLPTAA